MWKTHRISNNGFQTLTWDWSKWIITFRSAGQSLAPSVMAVPAAGSSCGEKQACSHSENDIICTRCILSSLRRCILLRKSFTSWSLMPSSSWRPGDSEWRADFQEESHWCKTTQHRMNRLSELSDTLPAELDSLDLFWECCCIMHPLVMKTFWHLQSFDIHMTLGMREGSLWSVQIINLQASSCDWTSGRERCSQTCEGELLFLCTARGKSAAWTAFNASLQGSNLLWQRPLRDYVEPQWSQEWRISASFQLAFIWTSASV